MTGRLIEIYRDRDAELRRIGYDSYKAYIASEAWSNRRERYWETHPRACLICDEREGKIDLHHNTYIRVGREEDGDLCWLCDECHEWVHNSNILNVPRYLNRFRTTLNLPPKVASLPRKKRKPVVKTPMDSSTFKVISQGVYDITIKGIALTVETDPDLTEREVRSRVMRYHQHDLPQWAGLTLKV